MSEAMFCDDLLTAAFPGILKHDPICAKSSHFTVPKDRLPAISHYLHTQPSLRGRLTLLWACDDRPVRVPLFIWRRDWDWLCGEPL